jgi:hypothetical protein
MQIADRYRLIERVAVDDSGSVEFWLASDSVLARQVGATLVARSSDADRSLWTARMVTALLRWGQLSHPGCPRILDVVGVGHGPDRRGLPEQISVAAVTDWAPGPALLAFLGDGPGARSLDGDRSEPVGAATAVRGPVEAATALAMLSPLVAAAETAHGQGLLLGCDRPQTLTIAHAGTRTAHVHLSFLLPDPTRDPSDDVRGLGAVLYALLTGNWPGGWANGVVGPDHRGNAVAPPVAPHVLDPAVPRTVSELAMSALGLLSSVPGVRTAAAFRRTIDDLRDTKSASPLGGEYDGRSDRDPPTSRQSTRNSKGSGVQSSAMPGPIRWAKYRRRPGLLVAAACVVALLGVGAAAAGLWHHGRLEREQSASPPAVAPSSATGASPGSATPVAATVYDPTGQPDNPTQVWRALGTDPKAGWSTDTYLQPFPALKPGVGIMVGFAAPVQLTSLIITSPSIGSELQVRSAPSPTSALGETTLIASTILQAGDTVVPLTNSLPVTHVLVWITKLGGGGDDNVTEISNLRFLRATG